jgi:dTDP-4-dehydrorhamnose 3,5-epimerase
MIEPILSEGNISVDDRGQLSFVNEKIDSIQRFYIVSNHKSHFIRAWHGHRFEHKFVTVIQGSAIIGLVKIDDWNNPSKELIPKKYILSSNKPSLLYIPAGYANGFMNLSQDTKIMFFSTSTLEESKNDDYRFDPYYWNCWEIKER